MNALFEQIRHYRRNCSILARSHYLASDRLGVLNAWLGIPALLVSIAICSTLFASSAQNFPTWLLTAAGFASLGVTMLTGLQVFFRASERSMEHRAAGARFADIRRRLEVMELKYRGLDARAYSDGIQELETLLRELRELGALCPKVPDRYYWMAEKFYITENESVTFTQRGTELPSCDPQSAYPEGACGS